MPPEEGSHRWLRPAMVLTALVLAVAWILSGVLMREPPAPAEVHEREPMAVAVEKRQAESVEQVLVLQGRVEPFLRIQVRAETSGQITDWQVPVGARVDAEQELARLRMDDREARRQRALATLRERESELAATRQLVERDARPRIELEAREAAVAAARAELEAVELDIANTRIRAPVSGTVNRRLAERGDFLGIGDPVAEVIDNQPLLAVVQVPQHQIHRVEPGLPARIRFLDGRKAEGEVTYVATLAEPGTRTFRVEVKIPNDDRALPSGISAGVEIPTREVKAHLVSPAMVSLDDEGRAGISTVDGEDRVAFYPVEVVRTEPRGLWVTGAPEEIRLITTGQGFVRAGERVRPHEQPSDMNGDALRQITPGALQ